jgi:hypothetical protein
MVILTIGLSCLFAVACVAGYPPPLTGVSITGGNGFTATICTNNNYLGSVEFDGSSGDRYLFSSAYYYAAGASYGAHQWTWTSIPNDTNWTTTISKTGSTLKCIGSSAQYTVTRSIYWNGDKFTMTDALQNKGTAAIALTTNYAAVLTNVSTANTTCLSGLPFNYNNISGTYLTRDVATNPSIYMQQAKSCLGILFEDDVYRNQVYSLMQQDVSTGIYNKAAFANSVFGLPGNGSYTYNFSWYPGDNTWDYWKFVNTVRNDWGSNFTCYGPTCFDTSYATTGRSYGITVMTPWFRFDDGAGVPDSAYAGTEWESIREVMANVNSDGNAITKTPTFMCKIETPSVPIDKTCITNGSTLPGGGSPNWWYLQPLTTAQTSTVQAYSTAAQWADSTLWTSSAKNQQIIETLYIGPDWQSLDQNCADWFDLCVYQGAKPSTWQTYGTNWSNYALTDFDYETQYIKSQIDYTLTNCMTNAPAGCGKAVFLDEWVVADNVYDNESTDTAYSWNPRIDQGQFDGYSVNQSNQSIVSTYTDAALVGIPSRCYLLNYLINTKGAHPLTNGHPIDSESRQFAYDNFQECYSEAVPDLTHLKLLLSTGEPWPSQKMSMGHLAAPEAYGIWVYDPAYNTTGVDSAYGQQHYAQMISKYAIMCLRNGQLMEPYSYLVPTSGLGSGGYGILNVMYPFTPVELHEGYLIGKEKILTAKSGTFYWSKTVHSAQPATCKVFDSSGNPTTATTFTVSDTGTGTWKVVLALPNDWYDSCAIW